LRGYQWEDTVCLHPIPSDGIITPELGCAEEFEFMAITQSEGLNEGIDGILGMGPNYRAGPSYIK